MATTGDWVGVAGHRGGDEPNGPRSPMASGIPTFGCPPRCTSCGRPVTDLSHSPSNRVSPPPSRTTQPSGPTGRDFFAASTGERTSAAISPVLTENSHSPPARLAWCGPGNRRWRSVRRRGIHACDDACHGLSDRGRITVHSAISFTNHDSGTVRRGQHLAALTPARTLERSSHNVTMAKPVTFLAIRVTLMSNPSGTFPVRSHQLQPLVLPQPSQT